MTQETRLVNVTREGTGELSLRSLRDIHFKTNFIFSTVCVRAIWMDVISLCGDYVSQIRTRGQPVPGRA